MFIIKKENKITKSEDCCELIIESPTYGNLKVLFDECDLDIVKGYYWTILSTHSTRLYAFSGRLKNTMHRLILNPKDDLNVDHINGNSLDNRRCNLRECTFSDNMKNKSIDSRNKSGVSGVGWHQKGNGDIYAWKAYIGLNKKTINLGFFDNFEDAVKARKEAEEKYFGEVNRPAEHKQVVNGC